MATEVLNGFEAKQALLRGLNKLADSVRITLGPHGHLAGIERLNGSPSFTKDGITVASAISLSDPFENIGAQSITQVASKTVDQCGDGTTTSVILAQSIFVEGLRNIAAGSSPVGLKTGIEKAIVAVVQALAGLRKTIQGDAIEQIGIISANGDQQIGKLIADAMRRVGEHGVIAVEESKSTETSLDVVTGFQFDRGLLSPYFATNPEKMESILEDVRILITEQTISSAQQLLPVLQQVVNDHKPLLIIADEISGDALTVLVMNKLKGVFLSAAVLAPAFGERRKSILEDIAILTGGKALTENLGIKLETVKLEDLGRAKKVVINKGTTTIIDGAGNSLDIDARIQQIRNEIDAVKSKYGKEKLQERLAKLTGGVAVVRVGASTEIELKEKKDRVDDAVHATRAAVEEGIVAGGGTALVRCIPALDKLKLTGDERIGVGIVRRALEEPMRQLATNAGQSPDVIVQRVRKSKNPNFGWNAATGKFADLVESGVIDPAKVTRLALQNAASIAGLMLVTDSLIATVREPAKTENVAA